MSMFDTILDIIDDKGPISMPELCDEINDKNGKADIGQSVQIADVEAVITRKKDLFKVQDGSIMIDPNKDPIRLRVSLGGHPGPWYKINIDFAQQHFHYFEWHLSRHSNTKILPKRAGNLAAFKRQMYRYCIWNWLEFYEDDGLRLEDTYWDVKLETKGKIYKMKGNDSYPKEWANFCISLSKLIGKRIC
ncbi:hypothetical protein [Cytobacillus gottheilii]|uniref:Uncharacterized protein n=1 Tax=Cytobacillus gottheilii TaxID=859144 RepID=A0ABX8F8S6_9BACI|nr:hypothetical protein [Cytobacillus gottheilii]QVY59876.1 hypothetical protein J1899_12510 [Cytobacillus gottheilii]